MEVGRIKGAARMSLRPPSTALGPSRGRRTLAITERNHVNHDHDDEDDEEFEFLNIDEAAALLRIPVATLRWYRSVRKGPRSFKLGRRVHYDKRELRTWINAQRGSRDDR